MSDLDYVSCAEWFRAVSRGEFPEGFNLGFGLCLNFEDTFEVNDFPHLLSYLVGGGDPWADWPPYSGNSPYPVPSTLAGGDPRACFYEHWESKYEGEYGMLRKDLAAWIAILFELHEARRKLL